jgi:1,3-beta-glucanosyltransferase GAS5
LFFSEYGCNVPEPRLFTEVGAICTPSFRHLYTDIDSPEMTSVFSGGLVYEWTQEVSDYGLVDLSNGNLTLLPDYNNLKSEFQKTPLPNGDGGYKSSGPPSTCPANSSDFTSWQILPAIPPQAQAYIDNGAGQPLGFNGPSNQAAGPSVIPPPFHQ